MLDISVGSLVKVQLKYSDGYLLSNKNVAIGLVLHIFAEYDNVVYARVLVNDVVCSTSIHIENML